MTIRYISHYLICYSPKQGKSNYKTVIWHCSRLPYKIGN